MKSTINRAKKILEERGPREVARRIGYKSPGTLYSIRAGRINMGEKLAVQIVEAYQDQEKPAPATEKKKAPAKKPAQPPKKNEKDLKVKTKSGTLDLGNPRTADAFFQEAKRQEQMEATEAMARTAISKVVQNEVVPALNEKLGRFMEELKAIVAGLNPGLEGKIRAVLAGMIEEDYGLKPLPPDVKPVQPEPEPMRETVAIRTGDLPAEDLDPEDLVCMADGSQSPRTRRFWRRRK